MDGASALVSSSIPPPRAAKHYEAASIAPRYGMIENDRKNSFRPIPQNSHRLYSRRAALSGKKRKQ